MIRSHILSAVDWDVLCPWLLLRKSLKNAFTFRLLFVTTIHLLVVSLWLAAAFGWFSTSRTIEDFLQTYSPISAYVPHRSVILVDSNLTMESEQLQTEQMTPGTDPLAGMNSTTPSPLELLVKESQEEIAPEAESQYEPLPPKTKPTQSWQTVLNRKAAIFYTYFSTLMLWLVVARRMALQVTRGLNVSFRQIYSQVKTQILTLLYAYLFLLLGGFLLGLPMLLFRKLTVLAVNSTVIPGILTFVGLIYTTFCFFFLLGSGIGALFIPSVLVTENSDVFDALSRSFSYALQRPLRLAFYVLAALFFGLLGLLAMVVFATGILMLYKSAVGSVVVNPTSSAMLYAFSWVVSAYVFLFFVSAVQGIYLLLRRDVDAVELDAIWLPDPQGVPAPRLPELKGEAEPSK